MRPVVVHVAVDRPTDEVWAFVSDVENNPTWQRGMRSCRWTSPPPHGMGSTYDQVAHFLGRDVVSSFEVAEYVPGRRLTLRSTSGPFPIVETRTTEPSGDGSTVVRVVVEGDAGGFFRVAAPVLRSLVARTVRKDYERLRRLLESAPGA